MEDELRVGPGRDVELGEGADELGDDVAVLGEAIGDDVSVDLVDLGERGAGV